MTEATACPHCPDGHTPPDRGSQPWSAWVSFQRDGDGQPMQITVARSAGAHVAESDAQWVRERLNAPTAAVPVPPPADRAAILAEAADAVFALDYDVMVGEEGDENLGSMREAWDLGTIHAEKLLRRLAAEKEAAHLSADRAAYAQGIRDAIAELERDALGAIPRLRRLAAEAQPTTKPEHQPRRGDEFEAWLKAQRDEYGTRSSREWRALDEVLDTYRLHADTGTPLGEHVCEGNGCEHQEPAAGARQDETWTVKESTRRYAEELRSTTRTASADGHTDWECDAGAQLLVAAETPRPGRVATHHGTIYACARHRAAAVERITGAGYEADPQPAPPGHRWNPWPCGHVTAHGTGALTGLTGVRQDGAQSP